MTILLSRVARTRWVPHYAPQLRRILLPMPSELSQSFSCSCVNREVPKQIKIEPEQEKKTDSDPRINDLGRAIEDDFATIRQNYGII
jgi:triacylglycerol lipase